MKIVHLRTNGMKNPIGYHMDAVSLSWIVENNGIKGDNTSRLQHSRHSSDEAQQDVCFAVEISEDSKMEHIVCKIDKDTDSIGTEVNMNLKTSTRYYWRVFAKPTADPGTYPEIVYSEIAYFETPKAEKEWDAHWITSSAEGKNGIVFTDFVIHKRVKKARLSITGVGLYEAYLNGEKVSDEYLTPNFNDYDSYIQFQTYDVEPYLMTGSNHLEILLGNGWYKGRFINMGQGVDCNKYGDKQAALAELCITFEDGEKVFVRTDGSWRSKTSRIIFSDIYDGEEINDTVIQNEAEADLADDVGFERLEARRSLPVKCMMTKKPEKLIHTPKGELILDFGQNMAGWVKFLNRLPIGGKCRYIAGEILQDGCFYHENMRSARTMFAYTSDGEEKWIRPHFTWYGFRYILLEGFSEPVLPDDFIAEVLYSEMEQTGFLETGNDKVNRLISNALWGQRSNYIDVPTDCPQRDERLGWTGDTQVFSMTAAFNMDVGAFFCKHMHDVYQEQQKCGGKVPFIVPNICFGNQTSAAWGDIATIVPWNLYTMYGNGEVLKEQYPGMKAWTDYIVSRDRAGGDSGLWKIDSHFGDWLSLDAPKGAPTGGTDPVLIATAYYYYSADLTSRAAGELGFGEEEKYYRLLAGKIKRAFQKEYITAAGRLSEDTQTAHVLVLFTGLYRDGQEKKLADHLEQLILINHGKLNTGFVGTPYLCPVLSKYGKNELAYSLLLNEEYPGWLYSVNLGATTIWERWNSVLPDGKMNPEGMNSLNHYAYGCILEWIYQYAAGLRPSKPGWKEIIFKPMPDRRLGKMKARYHSISGMVSSSWEYRENGTIRYEFEVPFGTKAVICLPGQEEKSVASGWYEFIEKPPAAASGYHGYMKLSTLLENEKVRKIIQENAPGLAGLPPMFTDITLKESMMSVFTEYSELDYHMITEKLKEI